MSARLVEHLIGTPWLIHEAAMQTILEIAHREIPNPENIAAWKGILAPTAVERRPADALPGARRTGMRDGIAILRVQGPIFRHASIMTDLSGATALGEISLDLGLARDDSRVKGILLDIDSPGGQVTGIAELADAIRATAAEKPVVAHVEGMGASAAYWLASAASQIVVSPTGGLGSLGAVIGVTDTSARDKASGVKRFDFVSSQTPGKRPNPETADGAATYQRLVDAVASEFLDAIAAFRNTSVEALLAATHGGSVILGREAVAGGLADQLGGFEDALAVLAARAEPRSFVPAAAPHIRKEPALSTATPPVVADTPPVAPPAPPAPPVASAPNPADILAAERTRCAAIMAAAKPEFSALATLALNQGWTVEAFNDAQAASLGAVDAARADEKLKAFGGTIPAPVAGAGEPGDTTSLPPAERAKAEFAADPKIRAEFRTEAAYAAYLAAEARGAIRLIAKG